MGDVVERYLRELQRALPRGVEDREEIVLEVRDHLLEAALSLQAEGLSADEAERRAVRRFGDAREIAGQYPAARPSLRIRRAYLYLALFAATWVLSFGLSAVLAAPLGAVFGGFETRGVPMNPLLHATIVTGIAAALFGGHWLLRGSIAGTDHIVPPRALYLAAAALFFLRGAAFLAAGTAGHAVGPWSGASYGVSSWVVCWAIAGWFAVLYAGAGSRDTSHSA